MQIDLTDPDVIADRIPAPATPFTLPRDVATVTLALMRAKRSVAAEILAKPAEWQVCEACGNTVSAARCSCPFCHGYRFDTDELALIFACAVTLGRPLNLPLRRF